MGEEIVARIERMGQAGDGVARGEDGRLIFIPGALPDEEVRAEITEVRRNFSRAKLLGVNVAARDREMPPCPIFDACGGCTFQHWAYASELQYKETRVREALKRVAGFSDERVSPIVGSVSPYEYRNKGQFPVAGQGGMVAFGLYGRGSHRIIATDHCDIQDAVVNRVLKEVQGAARQVAVTPYEESLGQGVLRHVMVRSSRMTGEALVLLVVRVPDESLSIMAEHIMQRCPEVKGVGMNVNSERTNRILGEHTQILKGQDHIVDTILGLKFSLSFTSFFQVNPDQVGVLYQTALGFVNVGLTEVWDLYSGVGTLAALASQKALLVRALEANLDACRDAEENFRLNAIRNVTIVHGRVEDVIHNWVTSDKTPPDAVIVDPPRAGLVPSVVDSLNALRAKKIVYVSCNPDTWARDLLALHPRYALEEAIPVDMFPRTDHVEIASVLSLHEA